MKKYQVIYKDLEKLFIAKNIKLETFYPPSKN